MSDFQYLNDTHMDVLKELASIGSGNAVSALARMLNRKVEMPMPIIKLIEFKDIAMFVGGPENIILGILVSVSGDIRGIMMFLLKMESAQRMAEIATSRYGMSTTGEFNELEISAVQEIGNIMISSYLSSLSKLIHKTFKQSVPSLSIDMANAILSVPAIEFGKVSDKVLFIESGFSVDQASVSGYFILVPDLPSFVDILKALGVE